MKEKQRKKRKERKKRKKQKKRKKRKRKKKTGKFKIKPFFAKYVEVYISRKTILSAFHYFFHKNVLCTSEVIVLLLMQCIIYWQILNHFLPYLAQIFNQM